MTGINTKNVKTTTTKNITHFLLPSMGKHLQVPTTCLTNKFILVFLANLELTMSIYSCTNLMTFGAMLAGVYPLAGLTKPDRFKAKINVTFGRN